MFESTISNNKENVKPKCKTSSSEKNYKNVRFLGRGSVSAKVYP